MRDIKFRAWTEKQMLYRGLHDGNWYATPYNDAGGCHTVCSAHTDDRHNYKLMQFTGLTDKNGKEIYEGDIVEAINNYHGKEGEIKFKAKIIYNDNIGQFQISYLNRNNKFVNDDIWLKYFLKVIGNIYQNPILLK